MALFQYQALNLQGKTLRGMIDALSEKEAREKLREQKILPTVLKERRRVTRSSHLSGSELLAFTLQLSQLLQAGLPLYESLLALELQNRGEKWHGLLQNLCEKVKGGASLSEAMESHPKSFDSLYCAMIAAGESTGSLSDVCARLTTLLTRQIKLKKQITTAMMYPALLGSFAMAVLILLLTFVVPSIENLFEGREVNGLTSVVLASSHFLKNYWPIIFIVVMALGICLIWKGRSPAGKKKCYELCFKIPLLRTPLVNTAIARFTRTLGTLQHGGVPLIDSLRIARRVMRSPILEAHVEQAEIKIIEGSCLSKELATESFIPPLVIRMLSVGEETGAMASMLHKIADLYEEEVEKTLTRLTTLMQPLILLIMGVVVGIVMLAVLIPLTDIHSLTG